MRTVRENIWKCIFISMRYDQKNRKAFTNRIKKKRYNGEDFTMEKWTRFFYQPCLPLGERGQGE